MATWVMMNTVFGSEYMAQSRESSLQRSLEHYKAQYESLRTRISEVRSTSNRRMPQCAALLCPGHVSREFVVRQPLLGGSSWWAQ